MDDSPNNFVKSIKYLHLLMNRHIDDELKLYGLARSQFQVIHFVDKTGALMQKELQQTMQVKAATLTGIIDVLAKKGLIQRAESESDKRSNVLRLTHKGKKLKEAIPFLHEIIETRMLKDISSENKKLIATLIKQMTVNLEEKQGTF